MDIIKASGLTHEYFRRDEDNNIEEIEVAVDHVDLSVKEGEFIAIIGHN